MINYQSVPYKTTTHFFWNEYPFRIWVGEKFDSTIKATRDERKKTFIKHLASFKCESIRAVSAATKYGQPHINFVYCKTLDDVHQVIAKLDSNFTRIVEISGPESKEVMELMRDQTRTLFREPFHGKYPWKIHIRALKSEHEVEFITKWVKDVYGDLRTDAAYLAVIKHFYKPNRMTLFVADESDILIARLSLAQYTTRVTKTVSLKNNNNKVGQNEPNPVSETCRTETCRTGN